MDKTNVMRLLDAAKIPYTPYEYDKSITDGETIAAVLNENPDNVFKTLVTESDKKEHFVFVIPVNKTLNLKKAAKCVDVKSIAMIKQKELLPLTGYIHGGCSPIGMKKKFKTVFHETFVNFNTVYFSAGKVGYQVALNPNDAVKYTSALLFDIIV